jgi:PBSX family phage terminase large subunit
MRRQLQKIKADMKKPSIVATLPDRKVEISPIELLDYFIAAIRLGSIPTDHKLYSVFLEAAQDEDQGQIFECLRKLAREIEPERGTNDLFLPTGKQANSIIESIDAPKSINLWYGSVRSSKTIMSLIVWLWRCAHGRKGRRMMVGNTTETLELNCIEPLKDLLPSAINHVRGWRQFFIFGRTVSIRGANDVGQEKKFRGPTLLDAYADEVTTWSKSVFKMLRTRMDKAGATLLGTTNPDNPLHYIKTDYIDRVNEISIRLWHFVLDDNPGLTDEYKANLIAENPPGTVYYLRFILGLWVAAEGLVYNMFDAAKNVVHDLPHRWSNLVVGVDFGAASVTTYIMLGRAAEGPHVGKWIAWKEYYHDASSKTAKTTYEFSNDMKEFLKRDGGQWNVSSIEVDPSASPLKVQFRRDGMVGMKDADNAVQKGIMDVAAAFSSGKLLIHESCKHLLAEIQAYTWDPAAKSKGEDKPVKQNDHCLDALRYGARRIFRKAY